MDDYTETENKSWFQRLGESFAGVATGFVLIAAATWLLWWNEERTFKTAGAIGEAELVTQNVQDISRVDPALEGKVIHATGKADTQDSDTRHLRAVHRVERLHLQPPDYGHCGNGQDVRGSSLG